MELPLSESLEMTTYKFATPRRIQSNRPPWRVTSRLSINRKQCRTCWVKTGRISARAIPIARLLPLDACGHSPHHDQPQAVLAASKEFVTRIAVARTSPRTQVR
jgi:pimeloyl-ACP methyl ester carboxylesterase